MRKTLIIMLLISLVSITAKRASFDFCSSEQLEKPTLESQLLFYSPYHYFGYINNDYLTSSNQKLVEGEVAAEQFANKIVTDEVNFNGAVNERKDNLTIIFITENGFEPKEVEVKINQRVIWKNKRERLPALILGVREISEMKSVFFQPEEYFYWSFSEPGEYTYVDGVVIGRVGKIIVN